eukprot:6477863-Amphidinium_carterae.2
MNACILATPATADRIQERPPRESLGLCKRFREPLHLASGVRTHNVVSTSFCRFFSRHCYARDKATFSSAEYSSGIPLSQPCLERRLDWPGLPEGYNRRLVTKLAQRCEHDLVVVHPARRGSSCEINLYDLQPPAQLVRRSDWARLMSWTNKTSYGQATVCHFSQAVCSLCRQLSNADNPITPAQAWWFASRAFLSASLENIRS